LHIILFLQILFREIGLKAPFGSKGTGKDVLSKLEHELPKVILEWRKVQVSLTKVVNPFQQVLSLETGRVHGHYSHFTVTGRVAMSDPSIQCVPRDFDLEMDFTPDQIDEFAETCKIKFGTKLSSLLHQIETAKEMCSQPEYLKSNLISMRNVFVPCHDDFVLLSADYSQLELRILTHLCQDKGLLEVFKKGGDVMVMIASKWKNLPLEQVILLLINNILGINADFLFNLNFR
jgi:DNA polymerase I-like protein with 3'-5' exonuclease and polymerase domains